MTAGAVWNAGVENTLNEVFRALARDMGNQVTPIWAIFKQFFAQIGVALLPISRARDLETQIGRKILNI